MSMKPVLLSLGILCTFIAGGAEAASSSPRQSVSITNNSGGMIVQYALKAAQFRRAGTKVKFRGRCDSACTLYLGLPKHQVCVAPGAYFRFHSPSARSSRSARMAKSYMMGRYPSWVQSWIQRKGGLSGRLVTMDYAYASRFLPSCKIALDDRPKVSRS